MMGKDGQQLGDLRGEMKKSRKGKSREGAGFIWGEKRKDDGGKKVFFWKRNRGAARGFLLATEMFWG